MAKELKKKLDTSLSEFENLLNKNKSSSDSILSLCRFMSGASIGVFFSKEDLIDHNSEIQEYDVKSTLELYCDHNLLVDHIAIFCPRDTSEIEFDEEEDEFYCDTCQKHFSDEYVDKVEGYKTLLEIKYPKKEFEDFKDFDDLGEYKTRLLKGIPRFVHSIIKVKPHFLTDCIENKTAATEGDFRDEMLRSVSFVFDSEGEAIRGEGRSDLIIQGESGSLDRVIGEFKVWPRNDYQNVLNQLLHYFSPADDLGFIFMVNESASCILEKYRTLILDDSTYIDETLVNNPLLNNNSLKHFLTKHTHNGYEKYVYHFIFDIFELSVRPKKVAAVKKPVVNKAATPKKTAASKAVKSKKLR